MKIKKEEFQRSKEQHLLELFRQGIRSPQTLEKYEKTLKWLLTKFLEDILEGRKNSTSIATPSTEKQKADQKLKELQAKNDKVNQRLKTAPGSHG